MSLLDNFSSESLSDAVGDLLHRRSNEDYVSIDRVDRTFDYLAASGYLGQDFMPTKITEADKVGPKREANRAFKALVQTEIVNTEPQIITENLATNTEADQLSAHAEAAYRMLAEVYPENQGETTPQKPELG